MTEQAAFPCEGLGEIGMTLRDYFAAKAMLWCLEQDGLYSLKEISDKAYQIADYMLESRK
jgi:hypothetical protein